jgi:AcrR family transcriptional regulator
MPSQKSLSPEQGITPSRRQQARGIRSRAAILQAAARLATLRGLEGLSLGDLAAHLGISKSGLYAHFRSKEEMELAIVQTAVAIFEREVLAPAAKAAAEADAPSGIARLRALTDAFLSYVQRRVFPGGCFFAAVAAELETRPGPARDLVTQTRRRWLAALTECLGDAQSRSQLDRAADIAQLVFEVQAMLLAGNFQFILSGDRSSLKRARTGIDRILRRPNSVDARPRRGNV